MNTISPTIEYTFSYSEQTVSFLDVQIYLSESRKHKTKLCKKPTDCMTLLHFHSHHPLSYKEGIIYSQALRYKMIISEDHLPQEELNNLTRILLARAHPLHLIIKNKKALTHNCNYLLSQRTPQTETNILLIVAPFSDIDKLFAATIHKNWNTIANDTTLHYLAIQTLSLYQVQQHSQPSCPLYTNIWLLTAGFLTLLPTYTCMHQ